MFKPIAIDDIELHLLEDRHAAPLFALVDQNRAHLRQWLTWVDNTTGVDSTRQFIAESRTRYTRQTGLDAGIWHAGDLQGVIGLYNLNWKNRKVNIGYWLSAPSQGKGIMTRSCKALVDFCFDHLDLNRVEIYCAPENARSCAIPQRLNFTREGVLRQAVWLYDHYVDQTIYGMLRAEWPGE